MSLLPQSFHSLFFNSPVFHYSLCNHELCNVSQVAFSFLETYDLSVFKTVFAFPWNHEKKNLEALAKHLILISA